MTNQNIRILYFTSFFAAQGGASQSLLKLLELFNRGEFEAFAILPSAVRPQINELRLQPDIDRRIVYCRLDRISRELLNPVKLLRFLMSAITAIARIRRLLIEHRIDVLHANDIRDFHGPVAARLAGVPVAWHMRACRPNPFTRIPVASLIHLLATKIVAVSRGTAEMMLFRRSFAQDKVEVVYNPGPYRRQYHPQIDGSAIRRQFAIPADAPLITAIGKLSQRKGHMILVRAIPRILAQHPHARFMIVGGELPGHEKYAGMLHAEGADYVQSGHLIFTGERRDIPEIIAASDIVVQPSLCHDAFPGVVLEGMAIGKAVVACAAGGIPEQITDGEDGLLFEMGDAEALAARVIALLDTPELLARIQDNAWRNLDRKFNFEKFEHELGVLYRKLAAANPQKETATQRDARIRSCDHKSEKTLEPA